MKVELIIPIDKLRGMLRKDGYYFRMYRGQQIVQRSPTKWRDTPARKAAREKFIAMLLKVALPPVPRKWTPIPIVSNEARLELKKRVSLTKRHRRKPSIEEDE